MHDSLREIYAFWQYGFSKGKGVQDALMLWNIVWQRLIASNWNVSSQFRDVLKAFDMISRAQMLDDISPPYWFRRLLFTLLQRSCMFLYQIIYHTSTGVRQGDSMGPQLFRDSYDMSIGSWISSLRPLPWAQRLVLAYTMPQGHMMWLRQYLPTMFQDFLLPAPLVNLHLSMHRHQQLSVIDLPIAVYNSTMTKARSCYVFLARALASA